jgi:hypothetical protein
VNHHFTANSMLDILSLEDVALLEVLQRVDDQVVLTEADNVCRRIMFDRGLVTDGEFGLQLTDAGVLLCKSLHHRVAAALEAAKITANKRKPARQKR